MEKKTTKFKISGTKERPRVCAFKSNAAISAQAIDDVNGVTLCSADSFEIKEKKTMTEKAGLVGENLAAKLLKDKVEAIVFDRNRYRYHGVIKALAEGLRKGGIKF